MRINSLALTAVALIAASCGGAASVANTLSGSLGADLDLHFDEVELVDSPGYFTLKYNRLPADGGAKDLVLQLQVHASQLDLTVPITIDLAEQIGGAARGLFTRDVGGDPRHQLAPIAAGSITFQQAPRLGNHVDGSFTAQLATGAAPGAGEIVKGTFSATLANGGF